jgi:hypothetical protein
MLRILCRTSIGLLQRLVVATPSSRFGTPLLSIWPLKWSFISSLLNTWSIGNHLRQPPYVCFPNSVECSAPRSSPYQGHPTNPWCANPPTVPYPRKSWMVHNNIAHNVKLRSPSSCVISNAGIPCHNSRSSSTNGAMYTSQHSEVTDCLPGISKHNIKKNFFVHSHGGKL